MSVEADRIIAALDFPDGERATDFVRKCGDLLTWCKIGMELYTAEGPAIVEGMKRMGKKVFLDLKYHDIPNTVYRAVNQAAEIGADMVTVHASGGPDMIGAAAESAQESGIRIVAVTVLTSLDEKRFNLIGYEGTLLNGVMRLADMALGSGADGIVCSAREVKALRKKLGNSFIAVTPGIRLPGDEASDQKRITTPEKAMSDGADYLVIGRSLTGSSSPSQTLKMIYQRLENIPLEK